MKKSIITLAVAMFMAGTFFSSCSAPDKKVENAEEKVQDEKADVREAQQQLNEAQQAQQNETISDYQKFKNEVNEEINENDRRIAQLRIDLKNEKAEAREKLEIKIDKLEKRNHELRAKIDAHVDDGKSDWQEFKKEVKHDLEGIGHAFKDVTVKNTK